MTTRDERINALTKILEYAAHSKQPVFCGDIAFQEIVSGLGLEIRHDCSKLWTVYAEWNDTEIIKCSHFNDLMLLTTPYHTVQHLTQSQYMQR